MSFLIGITINNATYGRKIKEEQLPIALYPVWYKDLCMPGDDKKK